MPTTLNTILTIWFALYLVQFYYVKLYQKSAPLESDSKYSHGKSYLVIVFVLSCCPVLPHQDKNENCIMNSMCESLALSVCIAEHYLQKEKFSIEKMCLLWLPTCFSAFVCFVVFMFGEDRRPHFGEVMLQDWELI